MFLVGTSELYYSLSNLMLTLYMKMSSYFFLEIKHWCGGKSLGGLHTIITSRESRMRITNNRPVIAHCEKLKKEKKVSWLCGIATSVVTVAVALLICICAGAG
jgi:hypothetical protein